MSKKNIQDCIKDNLEGYFHDLRGAEPHAVYDMVVEIAEGKEVSGLNGKFNNNNIDVPSKLLDPQNITKDNLQDLVTANYITQDRFDELTK